MSNRDRLNAWILHTVEDNCHKIYGGWKQWIFDDLPNSIVELGPGTGVNCRYYHQGTVLTAIEPNLMTHDRLFRNAEKYGINLNILVPKSEGIALADESAEAVISTLTLCYLDNQTQFLNEIYRVLRPGGRFLFLEHVGAPKGTLLRRFQDLINRPWQWFLGGCKLNCETESALRTAAFSKIELEYFEIKSLIASPVPVKNHIEHFELKSLLPSPVKHHIVGIAIK